VLADDSLYLLGYAEDDESPEAIAKKFQALEELERKTAAAASVAAAATATVSGTDSATTSPEQQPQLSEQALKELFVQTSMFTVESANQTEPPLEDDERAIIEYEEDEFGNFFFFDDDGGDGDDDDDEDSDDGTWGQTRRRKRGRRSIEPRQPQREKKEKGSGLTKRGFVRKSAAAALGAVAYVRIPNEPVPSSWATRILPYVPKAARLSVHTAWRSEDVTLSKPVTYKLEAPPHSSAVPLANLHARCDALLRLSRACGGFNGVVMRPPWKEPRPGTVLAAGLVPEDLLKLTVLGSKEFLPAGFVYIWSPKHWLHRIVLALETMDLHYVENAVVVWRAPGDGPLVRAPCTYFAQSKETLLILRRGERAAVGKTVQWERVEMRHQRTSDVIEVAAGCEYQPYTYVHKMVETMLPEARFNEGKDAVKPRLIELWGRANARRTGWVNVFEPSAVA